MSVQDQIFASPGYFIKAYLSTAPYVMGTSGFIALVLPSLTVTSPSAANWLVWLWLGSEDDALSIAIS